MSEIVISAELMASILSKQTSWKILNVKETHINSMMVKGSSVPARNRLKTLPTF